MKVKEQLHSYPLRLPVQLRQTLQGMANANRRSLAAEIVFRLEAVVNAEAAPKQGAAQ